MKILKAFGRGLQNGFVAIGALAFLGTVIALAANYAVTVGSGTTFGSVVVGGVNYAQQFICDLTTPAQCAAVDSSGNLSVKSATLATAANQTTANTSLSTIATNTGAAPPLATTGGWTPKTLAALSNTAVAIKASAGQVGLIVCSNADATHWAYIQLYNLAAGSVSVGSTAPSMFVGIPPGQTAGMVKDIVGEQFGTAISAAATSTATGGTGPNTAPDCTVDFN